MTNKPDNTDVQNMSKDDFFETADTPPDNAPYKFEQPYDIGNQLKDGLKQAGYQAGTNFVIQTILNLLPLPYSHKRNIMNKINRGEAVTITDVIFGGITAGRIIRSVIGFIIFAVVMLFLLSRGLL